MIELQKDFPNLAILGASRKQEYVLYRTALGYMLYQYGVPVQAIGTMLGNRDHSTIIHYAKTVDNAYQNPFGFWNSKLLFAVLEIKAAAQRLSANVPALEIFRTAIDNSERMKRRLVRGL